MGVAGEAQICVLRQGDMRVFPPRGTDSFGGSFAVEQQPLPPLGVDEFLTEVGLFHCPIEEGDLIILASSGLSQVARQGDVTEAARGGLDELTDTLSSVASHSDLSALLIEVQVAESASVPQREVPHLRQRSLPAQVTPVRDRDRPKRAPQVPPRGIAAGLVALLLAVAARILAFFAGLATGIQRFFSWLFSSGLLGRLGRGLRAGLASLLQGLGTLTTRMLPESEPVTTATDVMYGDRIKRVAREEKGSRLPLVFVLAVVAIVAAVSIGTVMRSHSRQTQFSQYVEQAKAEIQLARTSETTAATREHLSQARGSVELALELKPASADATALQDEILLALDEVNRVVRLQFSASVPFAEPSDQPLRTLQYENHVYILDQGTQRLYSYVLEDTGGIQEAPGRALLLSPDIQPAGLEVQELIDFAWIEAGSGRETGNLLVLANGTSLLELDESVGFTPVSVADTEVWHEPRLIDGYSGYLYVVDVQDDRILKYAPTGNSYDSFPVSYFQADTVVDLEGVLDMAIDGYIYILVDKSILKFSGGLQESYSLSGLDGQALEDPVALFTSPETQHIYVADAGNGRVVQFTKEGAFVRQFLPPREEGDAFLNLQDISVDQAQGQLVALTSDGLFVAPIQQPPAVIE